MPEAVMTKDLPVIDKSGEVYDQDRLFSVYLIANSNYKATFGINIASLNRGILTAMLENGVFKSRYSGISDPDPELGEEGDLYFKYYWVTDSITGVYVKYADEWQSL